MTSQPSDNSFSELEARLGPIVNLQHVGSILSWDQQVIMPSGGTPARAKQLSTVSRLAHDMIADEEIGGMLDVLEGADLAGDERAIVREARREHERAVRVSGELIQKIRETTTEAHPIWEEARAANDFEQFAPIFEEIIELKREYARQLDPEADPYEVLFADYEPYLELETADRVLSSLRDGIVPLIDRVREAEDLASGVFDVPVAPDRQESLCRDVLDAVGFDWSRGRLDTSTHPFSTGTQFDARITTRFQEHDLLSGLTAVIHEFGHAQYTLGLPTEAYGTPLGLPRGLTVHESQSRLWENHIARSQPFWRFILPVISDQVPALSGVDPQVAYEAANVVRPDNPIRVEADELTYHLHIVIRYEIERELIAGDLDVRSVPEVWNDRYESYLGRRPESDAEGCLQDIHWSKGSIGYFPTYSLGSVLSAQLIAAIEREIPDLADRVALGRFDALTDWLRAEIHAHGQRYPTPELIERATGEPYTADHFLAYVRDKYGDLYGL